LTQPPAGNGRIYNGRIFAVVVLKKGAQTDNASCKGRSRVANIFDDENQSYCVLINAFGQHSIWPSSLPVPHGWHLIHGPSDRHAAVHFVDLHWTNLRPTNLSAVNH
jgi:MbtH protein